MNAIELQKYLLSKYPKEDASCDWKEMQNLKNEFSGHEKDDVVSYVSAIANMEGGNLIIGVKDKTLEIVGTDTYNYDSQKAVLRLTELCTNLSSEGLFIEEYITDDSHLKVWDIHIPKHKPRQPVFAHGKAWQRIEDSLVEMRAERMQTILTETFIKKDWSAEIIPDATIEEDLDPVAIAKARDKYKELHPEKEVEIKSWDDVTFLNKAKLTIKGKVTMAAIILVGKEESEHYLLPKVCKIRWILKDSNSENKDFHIFSIPMILAIDEIANRIRNTTYEYTINGSMFPETMKRYDVFTLREPLNNAIAHQDYNKCTRIEITEFEDDHLIFQNHGHFIPESVEQVLLHNSPESYYRNPFLVEAMRSVHMIETEGGGIRKLFEQQRRRFFPMPEYDISNEMVSVCIQGKVIDEHFANILANIPNLSLADILLLDKVQKQKMLSDEEIKYLRKNNLVEGRKTNLFLSKSIANSSGNVNLKSNYVRNKSFDDDYFKNMIIQYIAKFGKASRKDIDNLILPKLSDVLNDIQKKNKVTNILASLRRTNKIQINVHRQWMIGKG